MSTDALIGKLVREATPLQPLRAPWLRGVIWLLISLPYVALVAWAFGFRVNLLVKLWDLRFALEQFAALATGLMAAIAAFGTVIPGNTRRYALLAIVPLTLWVGSVITGCLLDLTHAGHHAAQFHFDWLCFPGIVIVGLLPGVLIVLMLRRGAPLFPVESTALAGLATAGLGDFGFRLFHAEDAALTVLVWQMGTVFLLTAVAALSGKHVLSWKALVRNQVIEDKI